jgi:hypothetical protein
MQPRADILIFDYVGLSKIISGGQWGADRGGLEAAKAFGVNTGGTAPNGWKTCQVPALELKAFGLKEDSSTWYDNRTRANVIDSDGTLIVASNVVSSGTRLTINICEKNKKPCFIFDLKRYDAEILFLTEFILANNITVLNVAGNRDYKNKHHQQLAFNIVTDLFKNLVFF